MKKLSDIHIGETGIIKSINSKYINRLTSMGLVPGSKIKLLRIAPVGDPLEFEIKSYALSLRKETCLNVEVEIIE